LAARLVTQGADVTLVDSLIPQYGGNLYNVAPIRDRVRVNISDVRDEFSMKYLVQDKDYLFNLAGQTSHIDSMNDPYPDLDINARAQLSILEACRHHNPNVVVVFASTRQVYGRPQRLPVDETHPVAPIDVNGINKLAGEWYHLVYHQVYGIRSSVLRLTNTYGPRMRIKDARQTFLGIWIKRLLAGEPLLVFGDGKQLRDFNYVDDVVDAMIASAVVSEAQGQIFNLGHDEPIDLVTAAETMIAAHGAGSFEIVPFPEGRKRIDIGDYYGDFGRAREVLGWTPKHSFREGIDKTIAYYRDHGEHYDDASPATGAGARG
jgi:nucleoside-diphosphate-sugar epimerase